MEKPVKKQVPNLPWKIRCRRDFLVRDTELVLSSPSKGMAGQFVDEDLLTPAMTLHSEGEIASIATFSPLSHLTNIKI